MKIEKLKSPPFSIPRNEFQAELIVRMGIKINELIDAFNLIEISAKDGWTITQNPNQAISKIKEEKELEILNCPFCGNQPTIVEQCKSFYRLQCLECLGKRRATIDFHGKTQQEAIDAWNSRHD